MKTWEEMSDREQLECTHYEMFKDTYGFRCSSYDYASKSDEDIRVDMAHMAEEMKRQEAFELEAAAKQVAAFEERVQATIEAGAQDRETAIRWLLEAEEDPYVMGDPDYYCHKYGLPYGYLKLKEAA